MNSNGTGSPGIALTSTPTLFGILGLQTQNVAHPIVTLSGTVGISGDFGDTLTIHIVRGTSYSPANVIYTAESVVTSIATTEIHTFTAMDMFAPAAMETVYTTFSSGVSTSVRNGPEVFSGEASI